MIDVKQLIQKVAPMTREQYEAKIAYCKSQAYDLVNSITCRRKNVCLRGFIRRGNHLHETIIKYSDWNPCTQRLKVSYNFCENEIPKIVAQESIFDYLMMDFEDSFFY